MTTTILGQTVSHDRVIEPLGEGGMGVVHRAEDVTRSSHDRDAQKLQTERD